MGRWDGGVRGWPGSQTLPRQFRPLAIPSTLPSQALPSQTALPCTTRGQGRRGREEGREDGREGRGGRLTEERTGGERLQLGVHKSNSLTNVRGWEGAPRVRPNPREPSLQVEREGARARAGIRRSASLRALLTNTGGAGHYTMC